jgi:hypothetical protein
MGLQSERLQFQGRLGEKKIEAKKKEIKMAGLVDAMRDNLNPFSEEIEDLNTELVVEQALDLAQLKIDYVGIMQEIKAIQKALGK